jgi:phage baseplate assembly protein W
MRRDYGSRLFELLDRPVNDELHVEITAAIAEALDKWEPRLRLTWCKVVAIQAGKVTVDLRGIYVPDGAAIAMEGLVV